MRDPENPNDVVGSSIQAECLDRALVAAFELELPEPSPHETVHEALGPITGISTRLRLRPAADAEALPAAKPATSGSERIGRYDVLGEIARGGLGVVLKGHDADLGRDVALKVLLDRHAGDASMTRRLLEEAQIGGQLQHPGIVPIYEMGLRDDLRPYFSMKLVQGRTLASLLGERGEPAEDRMRLLAIFEQVCHAVGYAHSRGVVHRDLKPSNVMVGSFGEVQVVDWGLAKVLADSPGAADATSPTPRSGAAGSAAATSSVAGTPAYMAPEQARGETWRIDERTDVFGLGAILCEILTGAPPYVAASSEELRFLAAAGDLNSAHERLATSGTEADLLALARQCLACEPEARPGNASELARRVAAHRASVDTRAREAERAVEIERHRRQRLLQGGLAGLLVLAIAGVAWGWIAGDRRTRIERTRQAVDAAIERANLRWGEARGASDDAAARWTAALAATQEAESLAQAGDADAPTSGRVDELATRLRADAEGARSDAALRSLELGTVERLEEIRNARGDSLRTDLLQHDEAYRTAFCALGMDLPGAEPAATAAAIRATQVAGDLVAALDDWVRMLRGVKREDIPSYWQELAQVASLADDDETRKRMRDAWLGGKADELRALADAPEIASWSTSSTSLLGFCLADLGDAGAAVRLLRAAQRAHPDDYWINHDLAISLGAAGTGNRAEHLRFMTAALALSPQSYHAWSDYGSALAASHDLQGAIAAFRRALDIRPDAKSAQQQMGDLLDKATGQQVALAALASVIELDPSNALAHDSLGRTKWLAGDLEGAVSAYREALRLSPQDFEVWHDLGCTLTTKGELNDAVSAFREALRLQPQFAGAHVGLGNALTLQGRFAQAAEECRAAVRADPELAGAHSLLSRALYMLDDLKAAEAAAREALRLDRKPDFLSNLGAVLREQGRIDEAVPLFEEALGQESDRWLVLLNFGMTKLRQGQLQMANDLLRRAADVRPDVPVLQIHLGIVRKNLNDLSGAEQAFREAIRLRPDYADAHARLGVLLFEEGRLEESASLLQRAVELRPGNVTIRNNLALLLNNLGRVEEAVSAAREAVLLDSDQPLPWWVLGAAQERMGHYSDAADAYRRAAALGDPEAPALLAECEKMAALERRLPEVLSHEDISVSAEEQLGLGRLCLARNDVQNAAAFFEAAFSTGDRFGTAPINHPYAIGANAAARAGFGDPDDASLPNHAQAAHWRKRAIEWLEMDLKESSPHLGPGTPMEGALVRKHLSAWRESADLAGMRDEKRLAQLASDEQAAVAGLWAALDRALGTGGR